MADESDRGDHDERRRRGDQGCVEPVDLKHWWVGVDARERQRVGRGGVDAALVQLGQWAVWADDSGLEGEKAGDFEDKLPGEVGRMFKDHRVRRN